MRFRFDAAQISAVQIHAVQISTLSSLAGRGALWAAPYHRHALRRMS